MQTNLFESQFQIYHSDNPEVYRLYKRFALQAIDAGAKHLGSKAIMERIRWQTNVETVGDPFKVNNNLTPFYARLFMKDFPEYADFFRTRASRADKEI